MLLEVVVNILASAILLAFGFVAGKFRATAAVRTEQERELRVGFHVVATHA